jgi:hypothetical protein
MRKRLCVQYVKHPNKVTKTLCYNRERKCLILEGTMVVYTPMIQQYLQVKAEYQDAFLFFRLGDFYELFVRP